MNSYSEKAMNYFSEGYNCAQSLVLTFSDEIGLDKKTALMLSSSFGGGMGRLREVCGAVSGMFIVAGLLSGYTEPDDLSGKKEHYRLIQELAQKFREKNASIICRELIGNTDANPGSHVPEKRTEEYYKKRPCKELVGDAAEIIGEYYIENFRK